MFERNVSEGIAFVKKENRDSGLSAKPHGLNHVVIRLPYFSEKRIAVWTVEK